MTKNSLSAVSAPSAPDFTFCALDGISAPSVSAAEKALSAPIPDTLLSAVFYDAEKGTFLRGDHVYNAFCACGVSADAFCSWCAERWLQRVDTSYEHAVRLAAAVVYDWCDPYEIADTFCDPDIMTIADAEKHAVKVTADDLFQAGENAAAVYEFIADMYGETEQAEKLVRLMDEMRLFIKARQLQKKKGM